MYSIDDFVNISPKVAPKNCHIAQIKNRCCWGRDNKYLVLFPNNTVVWTNQMAIIGHASYKFNQQLSLF